jgi:hypothetical protein
MGPSPSSDLIVATEGMLRLGEAGAMVLIVLPAPPAAHWPGSLLAAGLPAAAVPSSGLPASSLPAALRPLAQALQRYGFKVQLAPPPTPRSYGEYVRRTRTLWIAPLSFELGIGTQVFLHEATHAVQSCPHGVLTPVGWKLSLAPVVSQEISGMLVNNYHHGNQVVEQEAFALQGQADAIPRLMKALASRCTATPGKKVVKKG